MENKIISVIGTVSSRLPDLPIKDGQIVFVKDKKKVALDLDGERTFYNEIITFDNDNERLDLLAPINGCFYFVVKTAVLWTYQNKWIQITTSPEEVVFFGTEIPELGKANILYVNKNKKNISVWDNDTNSYVVVGEAVDLVTNDDIDKFFK